eukprot:6973981-Pyramimonas_sp.AAC.1
MTPGVVDTICWFKQDGQIEKDPPRSSCKRCRGCGAPARFNRIVFHNMDRSTKIAISFSGRGTGSAY